MKLRGPRTLLGLVLFGLALAMLPLLIAVGFAAYRIDGLTQASTIVLGDMETVTLQNRRLQSLLVRMERNARQYQVLQTNQSDTADERLAEYRVDRESLPDIITDLDVLTPDEETSTRLQNIAARLRTLETALREGDTSLTQEEIERRFDNINDAVQTIYETMRDYIDARNSALRAEMMRSQEFLGWTTAMLLPSAIVLTLLFVLLIGRPMTKIDRAIRELGGGDYEHEISISGPRDIETLAQRLEWLRLRLIEATEEKNRFLRHMSHELKTPLANIREGSELLMDGSVGALETQQEEVADILRLNSIKLQTLIENLLTFSAWQTKTTTIELSTFELKPLVFSVVSQHRLAISSGHIKLRLRVETIKVYADEGKVRLVLENLVSNAIKFTPAGGTIGVSAEIDGDELVIDVSDSGPGVAPEDRDRIFEAFYQGKRLQGGRVGGTGIGLSIVAECVQAHGGDVELRDNGDSGATFHVRIPLRQAEDSEVLAANA